MPQHLSYSQLSMYLRCSEQYRFRYVDGIKEPPALAPTAGKAGHASLEANNLVKIKTGTDMPEPDLLDHFSGAYDKAVVEVDDLKPGEDKGVRKDELVNSLTVYSRRVAPHVLPILTETGFDIQLPTPEPIRIVKGFVDLVDIDPGQPNFNIRDYKFTNSRQPKSQLEIDSSIQLSLYDIAFEQLYGKPPRSVGIIQLIPPGRDPIRYPADVKVIRRDPARMTTKARQTRQARTINQFYQVERAIQAGIFMPTDDPRVCSWCGYKDRCQSSLV